MLAKEERGNEAREHKSGFLRIFLGTLCPSLLGNVLAGKGVLIAAKETIKVGQMF